MVVPGLPGAHCSGSERIVKVTGPDRSGAAHGAYAWYGNRKKDAVFSEGYCHLYPLIFEVNLRCLGYRQNLGLMARSMTIHIS